METKPRELVYRVTFPEAQMRSQKAQTLKLHLLFWYTGMYKLHIVNMCLYTVFRLPACCV